MRFRAVAGIASAGAAASLMRHGGDATAGGRPAGGPDPKPLVMPSAM